METKQAAQLNPASLAVVGLGFAIECSSASFPVWSETIANVANGFNVDWAVRCGFDLGTQSRDAPVDAAHGDDDGVTPDGIQNLVSRERSSRSRSKIREEAELFCRQLYLLAATKEFMCGQAQFVVAKSHHILLRRSGSAQESFDSRDQLAAPKRFDDVIVSTKIQPQDSAPG